MKPEKLIALAKSTVRKYTKNDVEDLAQDAILAYLETCNQHATEREKCSLLITIAKNKVINHLKKAKETIDIEKIDHSSGPYNLDAKIELDDILSQIRCHKQHAVIYDYFISGFNLKQTAERNNLNINTIKSIVSRFRKKLI